MRPLSGAPPPTAVFEAGRGPAVVLLHGVPTSGALWRPVAARLAGAGLRVIVPDLPGWGQAAALPGRPTVGAHVAWLNRLLGALGARSPLVVGHDLGGLLALEMVAAGTARGACLCSAWGGLGWLGARLTAMPLLERFFYRHHGGRLYIRRGSAPDRRGAALRTFGPALDDPAVVPHMRAIARGLSARRLRRLPGRVRRTGLPVHCLWGADDPFVPAWAARRVARGLGAGLELIEGARHLAPHDRPEAVAAALRRWVGRCPGAVGADTAEGPSAPEP